MTADVKLGEGLFMWPSPERRTDRYGLVGLTSGRWDDPNGVQLLDVAAAKGIVGKIGTLVATVTGPQESSHVGDAFRRIRQQAIPRKGAELELCKVPGEAVLQYVANDPWVGIRPLDGRAKDWLDPQTLYNLHESRVVLSFREAKP